MRTAVYKAYMRIAKLIHRRDWTKRQLIELPLTIMNDFFKVLADETRLRCLAIIVVHKEVCVCELVHALGLPQSKVSRHLSIMKLNNIISQRKEGQWAFYSVHPELSVFKQKVIKLIIQEQNTIKLFQADNKKLSSMNNRPVIVDR